MGRRSAENRGSIISNNRWADEGRAGAGQSKAYEKSLKLHYSWLWQATTTAAAQNYSRSHLANRPTLQNLAKCPSPQNLESYFAKNLKSDKHPKLGKLPATKTWPSPRTINNNINRNSFLVLFQIVTRYNKFWVDVWSVLVMWQLWHYLQMWQLWYLLPMICSLGKNISSLICISLA